MLWCAATMGARFPSRVSIGFCWTRLVLVSLLCKRMASQCCISVFLFLYTSAPALHSSGEPTLCPFSHVFAALPVTIHSYSVHCNTTPS